MKMRIKVLTVLLISITTSLFGQNEVTGYADFLKKQKDPKEYIFDLWETSDIIILGERDHRDTTQYNLILDILSDERFIEKVGHLYLEIGDVNATNEANNLIKNIYENISDFNKEFVKLQMIDNWGPYPWDKYNHYQLLYGLTKINNKLPQEKKITLGLLDMEFSWEDMDAEKYKKFNSYDMNKEFNTREEIMADNFLSFYPEQQSRNGRKKALIITSREYAAKFSVECRGNHVKRQAGYIKDVYGDNVKTVALNWYKWLPLDWQRQILPDKTNGLSANGLWDAAFELTGCKPVGFNLENTPFGKDEYDYPFDNSLKWEDVFDGYIFYEPYYNFIGKAGFPAELNLKQAREIVRRLIIYDYAYGDKKEARLLRWFGWIYKYQVKKDHSYQREFPCIGIYPDYSSWKKDMDKWL